MRSDMHGWPPMCIMRVVYFSLFNSEPCLLLCMKNLVCNNVELVNLLCNIMLYSGPAFKWT
jgi:hypothetical protein